MCIDGANASFLIVLEVRLAHEHTLLKIMVQLDRRGYKKVLLDMIVMFSKQIFNLVNKKLRKEN